MLELPGQKDQYSSRVQKQRTLDDKELKKGKIEVESDDDASSGSDEDSADSDSDSDDSDYSNASKYSQFLTN